MDLISVTNKQRDITYDIMRGIAICLVVLGHSIQINMQNYDDSFLFRIIYSFHMPLFMFISGAVTCISKGDDFSLTWLKKRFMTLIIPFIIWIFVPYIFIRCQFPVKDMLHDFVEVLKKPDNGGLWFLEVLFLNCIFLFISVNISKKISVPDLFVFLILYVLFFILTLKFFHFMGMDLFLTLSPYFLTGYSLVKYKEKISGYVSDRIKFAILIFLSLCFIFLISFWRRTEISTFLLSGFFSHFSLVSKVLINTFYRYLMGFSGISLVYLLSKSLLNSEKLTAKINLKITFSAALSFIGRYSIEVYILHMKYFGFSNYFDGMAEIIVDSLIGLTVALLIAYAFEKGIMNKILFGKKVNNSL